MKTIILLAGLVALIVLISGCTQPPNGNIPVPTEEQMRQELEKANYCSVKGDCARARCAYPLGCPLVNQAEKERINTLLKAYVESKPVWRDYVTLPGVIYCEDEKCIERVATQLGDACEEDSHCQIISCGQYRGICRENKCACP